MSRHVVFGSLLLGSLGSLQTIRASAYVFTDVNGVFTTTVVDVPGSMPGSTDVTGISFFGQTVGYYDDASGGVHGFLDTNGVYTTIDYASPGLRGPVYSSLQGISGSGQDMIGQYSAPSVSLSGGFTDVNGTFSSYLTPNFSDVFLTGINDQGTFVGYYFGATSVIGCLGLPSVGCGAPIVYPGAPTQGFVPVAINDNGQVLGSLTGGGAFLYYGGVFTPITGPGSIKYVNDLGQFVGTLPNGSGYLDTNGVVQLINVPGAAQTYPLAISDSGEIVGTFDPVPEPASLLLVGAGLAAIATLRRRRTERTSPAN